MPAEHTKCGVELARLAFEGALAARLESVVSAQNECVEVGLQARLVVLEVGPPRELGVGLVVRAPLPQRARFLEVLEVQLGAERADAGVLRSHGAWTANEPRAPRSSHARTSAVGAGA